MITSRKHPSVTPSHIHTPNRSWELVAVALLSQTSKLGLAIVWGNHVSRGWGGGAHISRHDILILTYDPNAQIFGKELS